MIFSMEPGFAGSGDEVSLISYLQPEPPKAVIMTSYPAATGQLYYWNDGVNIPSAVTVANYLVNSNAIGRGCYNGTRYAIPASIDGRGTIEVYTSTDGVSWDSGTASRSIAHTVGNPYFGSGSERAGPQSGCIANNHDNTRMILAKYTRDITTGDDYIIIAESTDGGNTWPANALVVDITTWCNTYTGEKTVAYDPQNNNVVIAALNGSSSAATTIGIRVYTLSGTLVNESSQVVDEGETVTRLYLGNPMYDPRDTTHPYRITYGLTTAETTGSRLYRRSMSTSNWDISSSKKIEAYHDTTSGSQMLPMGSETWDYSGHSVVMATSESGIGLLVLESSNGWADGLFITNLVGATAAGATAWTCASRGGQKGGVCGGRYWTSRSYAYVSWNDGTSYYGWQYSASGYWRPRTTIM